MNTNEHKYNIAETNNHRGTETQRDSQRVDEC